MQQPAKPLINLIRRLVETKGVVRNLHGNVTDSASAVLSEVQAGWYWVEGSGWAPRDVLADAAVNDRSASFVVSEAGFTGFDQLVDVRPNQVLLYTGVVPKVSSRLGGVIVPIGVHAPGAGIRIYVNDNLVRWGTDSVHTPINLGPGLGVIQVLLERPDLRNVQIEVPADLPIGYLPSPPAEPVWEASPIFGFFGSSREAAGLRLSWQDSSFAGAWRIEKTAYRSAGPVVAASYDSDTSTFTLEIDAAPTEAQVEALLEPDIALGTVLNSGPNAVNPAHSDVVIQTELTVLPTDWAGKELFVATAADVVGIIEREDASVPDSGIFTWIDTNVRERMPYAYRLAAIHPLHAEVESVWSEKVIGFAHDTTPPADITILERADLEDGLVVVRYRSPSDHDYKGTRLYYQDGSVYTPILNDLGEKDTDDQLSFYPIGLGTYWLRTFDWAGNVQPDGEGVSLSLQAPDYFGLANFREVNRDAASLVYEWTRGDRVTEIWVYDILKAEPVVADPWPGAEDPPTSKLFTEDTYTVTIPPSGFVRYVQFEPRDVRGMRAPMKRAIVFPPEVELHKIVSASALVNDADGSVRVHVEAPTTTRSYRYAYAVAASPTWPSVAQVETGTVRTITGSDTFSLAAGTVPLGQLIYLRFAPYVNADGTGASGPTDHGVIAAAFDDRTPSPAWMEIVTESENDTTGTFTIVVKDTSGRATKLESRTRSGDAAWSSWTTVASPPVNNTNYTRTVTLIEKHPSYVEFRLTCTEAGVSYITHLKSSGFDKGRNPNITIIPKIDENTGAASATVVGDADTAKVKILASNVSYPTANAVRAATAINGRVLTPSAVGTLCTPALGETVYYSAFGYGPNDEESSVLAQAEAVFRIISPTLSVAEESESDDIGTFRVKIQDPAGQADALYVRKKSGASPWTAWALVASNPAHNTTYSDTVTLVHRHQSFIEFKLEYTLYGVLEAVHLKSSGFDRGATPDIYSLSGAIKSDSTVEVWGTADKDALTVKIATSVTDFPTAATVRAEQAVAVTGGYFSRQIPTIVSATTPVVYVSAFAYNGAVESGLIKTTIVNVPQIPAAPSNLVLTWITPPANYKLDWHDNSFNETGFEIQRDRADGLGWQWLTQVPADTVTYTDPDTNPGGLGWGYRVRALGAIGNSDWIEAWS